MQVPEYKQQVQIGTPGRQTPQIQPQDASAFGVQQAGATANLGQAVSGLGERLAGHVIAKQELDNQQAVLEQATAYKEQVNSALRGTVDPATGQVTGGFLNTRLNAAQGATKQFADTMGKIAPQFIDKVNTEGQKRALANSMRQDYDSAMNLVAQHEAAQGRDAKLATFDTYFNASLQEVASQPATLAKNMDVVREKMWTYVQPVTGSKPEQTAQQIKEYNAKLVAAAITPAVQSGRIADARKILDENKANIPGTIYNTVDADLKDREFAAGVQTIWDKQMSGYKLADGMPDEAKMEQAVNALPNYTQEQKDKVWGYVKARANEDRVQISMKQNSMDHAFMNAMYQGKAQGKGLDYALSLAKNPAYSYDAYDREQKIEAAKKAYAPAPVKTNPYVYEALWEGIKSGTITNKATIDSALKNQSLSTESWTNLRQSLFTKTTTGDNPEMEWALSNAGSQAKAVLKKDEEVKVFMALVHQYSVGKSPEDVTRYAENQLKAVPKSGGFLGYGTQKGYQIDTKYKQESNYKVADLYAKYGQDVVQNIANGMTQGRRPWTVGDIESFGSELDAMLNKKETTISSGKSLKETNLYARIEDVPNKPNADPLLRPEVKNAILSAHKYHITVTPDSVLKILKHYKDGIIK